MKKLVLIFGVLNVLSFSAQSAIIQRAHYDSEREKIVVELGHSGGCGEHKFDLEHSPTCLETYPGQCSAKLIHETNDFCEAFLFDTVEFDVKNLEKPQYLNITDETDQSIRVYIRK